MTEELRDRLRYLRHLPLAQAFEVQSIHIVQNIRISKAFILLISMLLWLFEITDQTFVVSTPVPQVAELDISRLVSAATLALYSAQLEERARRRGRRDREERRREKRIEVTKSANTTNATNNKYKIHKSDSSFRWRSGD
jgi:hypothetical protein